MDRCVRGQKRKDGQKNGWMLRMNKDKLKKDRWMEEWIKERNEDG